MSRSSLFPRLFKQVNIQTSSPLKVSNSARPTLLSLKPSTITRVPVSRFIHSSPKEYNGLQSAAFHFKRQRHMPYFLEYFMWVVFGSEALHLIWLKIDYKEYKDKMHHKTKLLEEIIHRIENGEKIDDSLRDEIKMVLMNNKHEGEYHDDIDDEYLNNLIVSSEHTAASNVTKTIKKPVVESKWVEIEEETNGEKERKKKEPFFL